jgi:membrane protease YdiL (CAAX protease family)
VRVGRGLAWGLILLSLVTAGLLRQFHPGTPRSPLISPAVGSLLFAAVFVVLLVAAREWRQGASPGPGIRLGSLTPLVLMLLIEKWASTTLYLPVFYAVAPRDASEAALDGYFFVFAGAALVLLCLLLARLSRPARRRAFDLAAARRWPAAALGALLVCGGTYLILGLLAVALGGDLKLTWGNWSRLALWIVGGQILLAFAEELYYRGLLLAEFRRLAPRLGLRTGAARRWLALLATSFLFGLEHVNLDPAWPEIGRQMVFSVSLGLLFGILVLVTSNLHFVAAIHAWINVLLLGNAPRFVGVSEQPALPAGTYIGITLILAFVLAFALRRLRGGPRLQAV